MAIAEQTAIPAARSKRRRAPLSLGAFASYLQAAPLALILGMFLLLPILLLAAVSFWDYDFAAIYPAFLTTNYTDVLGSWVTWKTYLNRHSPRQRN